MKNDTEKRLKRRQFSERKLSVDKYYSKRPKTLKNFDRTEEKFNLRKEIQGLYA